MATTFAVGIYLYRSGKGGYLFSILNIFTFLGSIAALIGFISLYIYELPTHHCPFCILQSEYKYVGYPLYLGFLFGAVFGIGVGTIAPFERIKSLSEVVPAMQRRLTALALGTYSITMAIVLYWVIFSNLNMHG
jgi:hypothetical protein